jgi:hypothetical protein
MDHMNAMWANANGTATRVSSPDIACCTTIQTQRGTARYVASLLTMLLCACLQKATAKNMPSAHHAAMQCSEEEGGC